MTFEDILKSQNLTAEQITAIVSDMKQNKIFTAGEENLDIRYQKLKADHDNLTAQHKESATLIEQMKKDASGNEALQGKIATYETTITQLNEQLKQTQVDAAIKVALLGAKTTDVDYMTFKLKEKGEVALDDNGNIKGIDDMLSGLKTQFPNHFESVKDQKKIEVQKLEEHKANDSTVTKDEFNKMGYSARVKLRETNPELYGKLSN